MAVEHIEAIARRGRVKVNWRTGGIRRYEAHVSTRQIWISKPRSFLAYLSALHELGHVIDPVARRHDHRRPDPAMIDRDEIILEAAAWAWAVSNVHPQLWELRSSADMRAVAIMWGTYLGRTTR